VSLRSSVPSGEPLVSVVIGSYNAGKYLRESLMSVLEQTYTNLEIVLIDDGSTDESVDNVKDLTDSRLTIHHQHNQGRSATLNRAIELVRGKYYVIHDADDVSHPRRIERLVRAMEANAALAGVFSGHELIINGRRVAPRCRAISPPECKAFIDQFRMPAHDPTGMFRMSMVGAYRYSTDLPYTEAVDYILRVGEMFPIEVLGECLYAYRIHRQSITRRDPAKRQAYVQECLARACVRRGLDPRHAVATLVGKRLRNRDRDNNLAAHFMESACDLKVAGRRWDAFCVGARCAMIHPFDPHYQKALVYALTPMGFVTGSRRQEALAHG
jgi:glycosyltransferase involved in cell wall biosynthesis